MATRSSFSQLRIIGGSWRGRKLAFVPLPGLRPTPDRVRETLFNWLAPVIHGAACLDLFAGSGALGIEAASRGAGRCVLIERDTRAVRMLREQIDRLGGGQIEVIEADALLWLAAAPRPFDIVFVDPPFRAGLLPECIRLLESRGWLTNDAWVYLETAKDTQPDLPANWLPYRERCAGQVSYRLIRRSAAAAT
ncbi:MAG: 16S rRNA (guanine(966)-N(2))-methyltransferase RsmD [Pseudomonadota bacterium]